MNRRLRLEEWQFLHAWAACGAEILIKGRRLVASGERASGYSATLTVIVEQSPSIV
jgi:hypothetical protein